MRKFIVYPRPLPSECCKMSTDAPAIVEVEGEVITGTEDPSIAWLPAGEFRFKIMQPAFLMVPTVYHSHSIYSDASVARQVAEHMVREGFEFTQRKTGQAFSEEEVQTKCQEIQEVLL